MSIDEIKRVISSLKELPAMPNVVTKALGVIKDPDSGAKDLAKTIENDHAVTAELLKIVNSPYYGLSKSIQTVGQSITLLGFNEVKNIILSCAMKPMMTSQGGKNIWEHAVNTAVAAQTIAEKLGRTDGDECFAQGLMHDLGKIIFELHDKKRALEVSMLVAKGANILTAEKMVFGFDHTEVGYLLGNTWKLPRQIVSIMRNHHKPQNSEFKLSAGIIYVADRIVKDNLKGPVIEYDVAPKLGFEISNIDNFKKQALTKAKMLLIHLNTL